MTHVFKELVKQAEALFQLVGTKNIEALLANSSHFKNDFLKHIPAIKKVIVSWVSGKQRKKIIDLHHEVKETRVSLERSVRSRFLMDTTDLTVARNDLIVAAKKMIQIERLLTLADDMLFAGDILAQMNEAVQQAKSVVAEVNEAVEYMAQARKVKRLQQDDDSSYQTHLGR